MQAAIDDNPMVDDMLSAYLSWRQECDTVRHAYDLWSDTRSDDATLAFAAYRAALDREAQASDVYAGLAVAAGLGPEPHPEVAVRADNQEACRQ